MKVETVPLPSTTEDTLDSIVQILGRLVAQFDEAFTPPERRFILITGDPVAGLDYHGPCTRPEAEEYAEQHYPNDTWWITHLTPLAAGDDS
jgi:hypothetical protein